VIYVPPALGKTIAPGMTVQVSPFGTPREEYGFMIATVTSVSAFPTTTAGMMRVVGNASLVESFSQNGAPFAVHATFAADPASRSGFRWSSPRGAAQTVNSGTLCSASIITRLQRPIDLVLPTLNDPPGN
jgi:HlyD family secretion protein